MSRSRFYLITLASLIFSSASANATVIRHSHLEEKLAICINSAMPDRLSTDTVIHFNIDEEHVSKRFRRSLFVANITDKVTGADVGEIHCEFGLTGKVLSAKLVSS